MGPLSAIHRQRGVAAIVAILIVALAASTATYLVSRYSLALRHVENVTSRAQADQLARTAVFLIANVLGRDNTPETDDLFEEWALPLPPMTFEDATIQGRIQDEQGRFNLNNLVAPDNKASAQHITVFERLLASLKLEPRLVDAVIDWIDSDEELTAPAGAESTTYLGLPLPYRTANTRLTDVGELARIKGFDQEAIEKLLPFVTALPRQTKININTAPAEVLRALAPNLSADDAARMVDRRTKDRKFPLKEELLKGIPAESKGDVDGMIDVSTEFFSAIGAVRHGRIVAGYRALFERPKGQGNRRVAVIGLSEEPL